MNKVAIIFIFIVTTSSMQAQYHYKVEYNYTLTHQIVGQPNAVEFSEYEIRLRNNSSASSIYYAFAYANSPNSTRRDEVITLNFLPDSISSQSSIILAANGDCFYSTNQDFSDSAQCGIVISNQNHCVTPVGIGRIIRLRDLVNINGDTNLTSCESLTLKAAECVVPFSYKVEYQYQVDSGTDNWNTLLDYGVRSPSFAIDMTDFPGITGADTNLKLRIVYEDTPSPYDEILTLDLTKCSPKVLASSSTDESCEYTNDGNFTLTFDRPLDPGEIITTAILDWAGPNNILNDGDDINSYASLTDLIYAGTTYTWPSTLNSGVYRIRYQTNNTNTQESHEPIELNSPVPVAFTADYNDLTCFEDGSGSITISASGGTGSYAYSLDNGSTYSALISNPMTITGLSVGEYNVRVRDSNTCEQQN
ncbi:hypothetical protein GCM10009117_14680 [Gangjinia marincola]|uniref:SprB repeat-containing protein n=1 Tax=Gangjinia marincola TaxID=578463 RepID=A0ABP3XSQ4_9FLAO